MRKLIFGSLLMGATVLAACNSNTRPQNETNETMTEHLDHEHTSQTALDWAGTYKGTLPCADCPGIHTTITLHDNETFAYEADYQDRDLHVTDKGSFTWEENGNVVHLKGQDVDLKFHVGENRLFNLDQEGKRIEGELAENYVLEKSL